MKPYTVFLAILGIVAGIKSPCINPDSTTCILKDVYISSANFTVLTPSVVAQPEKINELEIILSNIEILTGDACTSLPQILHFRSSSVGIVVLGSGTFKACTNLTLLDLSYNKIENIPFDIFHSNVHIETLLLGGNQIKQIDTTLLYPIWQLKRLELQNNKIQDMSPVIFKKSRSIEILKLQSNELKDLDAEELIKTIPNLKIIYLADNDFVCKKMAQIVPVFSQHNVRVMMDIDRIRVRSYNVGHVNGTPCLESDVSELSNIPKLQHDMMNLEEKVNLLSEMVYNLTENVKNEKEMLHFYAYNSTFN